MSVSTAFIAFFAAVFLRNTPEELGLNPLGTGSSSFNSEKMTATGLILLKLGILYLIFGITYVVYGTFIVSTIISDYGFTETAAGVFWSVVGFFGMFSGIGFGAFSDRYGRKYGLAVVFAVQTAAYLLAGSAYSGLTLGASVFLYGISAFSIPTIMAAAMGDYFGASKAAVSFSIITLFFAAGQTGGPAAAGIFAQQTGSFAQSFIFCGFLTAAAAFISLILPNTD
jgi:MFS family permease